MILKHNTEKLYYVVKYTNISGGLILTCCDRDGALFFQSQASLVNSNK